MKIYARIQGPVVAEIIEPVAYDQDSPPGVEPQWKSGDEIPISARFNDALINGPISVMIDITSLTSQPQMNWSATELDGVWSFNAPK